MVKDDVPEVFQGAMYVYSIVASIIFIYNKSKVCCSKARQCYSGDTAFGHFEWKNNQAKSVRRLSYLRQLGGQFFPHFRLLAPLFSALAMQGWQLGLRHYGRSGDIVLLWPFRVRALRICH